MPDGRLAGFERNYGADVLAAARAGDARTALALAEGWIGASPPRADDAWHPYVVSTRLGNWVAALSLEPAVATRQVGESMRRQLAHLERNIEDDVLGNHVIRNARALLLAGASLEDERAVAHGRRLLARELPEQVLADGGHYERSPAYHRLVLRDLLEVAALADVAAVVERMTSFAAASSRPDGAPALFNDGGLDIAPRLDLPAAPDGLDVREETGYAFLRRGRVWLAFDCGAPGPSFLPAHAHADALSFQLWVDGRPMVLDPGTSTYTAGDTRRRERGTESHSTVAVDGDQFVVWSSFRSGPLPEVKLLEADETRLVGEASLPRGVRFRRVLRLDGDALHVEDRVTGQGAAGIVSSLPLLDEDAVHVEALAGAAETEARSFAERFGEAHQATARVVRVRAQLPWEGGWRIEWPR